jgi:iron(III) transport system permease protein
MPIRSQKPILLITLVAGVILLVAAVACATDGRTASLLWNTLRLAAATSLMAIPLGTCLAFVLLRTDIVGRRAAICVLATMLFVPLYLQAAGWDAGFGRQGWLSLSQGTLATPLLAGWRAVIWIHSIAAIPWVVLIVGIRLRYAEPELEDAASLDGSAAQVFLRITLPRAIPAVLVAALWIMITTAGEMTVTDLYQVRTYAEEIYANVPSYGEFATHGLAALPGMLLVTGLILVTLVAASFIMPPSRVASLSEQRNISLGKWRWPGSCAVLLIVLLIAGVPLANLCINAGLMVEKVDDHPVRFWSGLKFVRVVLASPFQFWDEFRWTNVIGNLVGLAAVVLAGPLAWAARRAAIGSWLVLVPTAVCLALPGPMIGLSIIWLLNRDSSPLLIRLYDHTILAPCLATLVRAFPMAMLIIWFSLRTVSADVLDAASTDGAGVVKRFTHIALPQRKLAFGVAWFAAVIIAIGDLSASILVTPPGVSTIPIRVFGLLHAGVDDQVAGLCLTMVGEFVVLAAITISGVVWAENRVRAKRHRRV